MSDDSFIREVNVELRQERARALWGRYGPVLIGLAIVLVIATGLYKGYSFWQTKKSARIGDEFLQALQLADAKDFSAASKTLSNVEKTDFGGYSALAKLRAASLEQEQGNNDKALQDYDAISKDRSIPLILQKIAKVRAAFILVDDGTLEDVEERVKDLATDIDPFRVAAREALGLAEWKSGNNEKAVHYFTQIKQENSSQTSATMRAQLMLDLIASSGKITEGQK